MNNKFRMLVAAGVLMFAGSVSAAPVVYQLDNVTWQSPFAPSPGVIGVDLLGQCPGCVGGSGPLSLATVDGANVAFTNIAFGLGNMSSNYLLTVPSAASIVGTGVALVKTGTTCVASVGSACNPASTRSALLFPVDFTGQAADGSACTLCAINVIVSPDQSKLTLEIRKQFTQTFAGQQVYRLNYSVVPVPGAVWLLGSAIGLLGWARGRRAA